MSERSKPYIGVSGVGSPENQAQLIDLFSKVEPGTKRSLLLGVKALHKCQWLDQPWVRDGSWDLVGEHAFANALTRRQKTVNIAQAYFDMREVGNEAYRDAFLNRIYRRGSAWIDGIQLDMLPWHENRDMFTFLHDIKNLHPSTKVLLQCHNKAMERYNPKQMAAILGAHAEALDYILFDTSHGKGVRLDSSKLHPYIDAAYSNQNLDSVGIAVAGGLDGAVVVQDLPPLVEQYPGLSWDAEGRLHPAQDDGSMPLSIAAVADYFEASAHVIKD